MKVAGLGSQVLFCLLLLIAGCKQSSSITESQKGSGRIVTQVRTVDKCTGINLFMIGNIHITQDDIQSIRVEADDNIIDKVITTAQNGTLTAGLNDNSGSYSNITVNIYVSLETIDHLTIAGTGNITAHNPINSDTLHCTIAGAGNITLQGQGSYLDCLMAGAGNIMAESYLSKTCKVRLSGTGNCYVYASENLDAALSGVGSIYYYGNPKVLKTSSTGVGQIVKK